MSTFLRILTECTSGYCPRVTYNMQQRSPSSVFFLVEVRIRGVIVILTTADDLIADDDDLQRLGDDAGPWPSRSLVPIPATKTPATTQPSARRRNASGHDAEPVALITANDDDDPCRPTLSPQPLVPRRIRHQVRWSDGL